ncbi:recombination protein RecT [Xanthobacter flavus]|uniref:Recombination protein RecT n=1 Tax=Xanthobacter flavus TaxID=281 RepID=A0A9W6FKL4_XANFL|nr:recombinase RecT [Xanthobacter flavus]MDR6334537.1 recombination protein RecT [Xanthobacter flavus]GLI23446.1 hypothetical protein XFLAVUS301_31200 [Xanthobacter flavus]
MNTAVAPKDLTPVERYRMQVLPPDRAADLYRGLPSHIKPAVFERNLVNALMQNPDLLDFHPSLVYREVSKAAGLGLLLDPQLGEAYIVVAWNGKTRRQEPQLRIGYKGMQKLARQTGDVTNIYAHEVCASDQFRCRLGTDKNLEHEPDVFGERGPVVGYYAVIKFRDGTNDFEPMTVTQTQAIRDRSDAWKAFKDGKIKSTPWSTDEDEMAKKTVLRRLLKRQPQSPELSEAIKIEDEAEFPTFRERSSVVRVSGPKPPAPPAPASEDAEVPETTVVASTTTPPPPAALAPPAPTADLVSPLDKLTDPAVREMVTTSVQAPPHIAQRSAAPPAPPAPAAAPAREERAPSPAEGAQSPDRAPSPVPFPNLPEHLAGLWKQLSECENQIALENTWAFEEDDINGWSMADRERAAALYESRLAELYRKR